MSTFITYNQFSQPTSMSHMAGAEHITLSSQSWTYDPNGNLLSSTNANHNTTNFTVNAVGLPTSMTDPNNNTYTYQYDNLNQMVQETDPLADPVWTYDIAGDVTSFTDANGATTHYSYDAMGRLLQKSLPINATTSAIYSFAYDAAGNLISKSIPLDYNGSTLVSATSTYAYNGLNQLISTTDPLGNVTSYNYDADGNLIAVTNPLGNTMRYGYDADGRKVSESVPISGSGSSQIYATTTSTLDAAGETTAVTNPLGQTTQYTYNLLGWLTNVTDPSGNQTVYTYYDAGDVRSKTVQSASGTAETSYSHDHDRNLVGVLDPQGYLTSYTYDRNGNLLSVAVGNYGQGNLTYTYDAVNRLSSLTDAAGDVTQYSYDLVGNLSQETDPLGNVTSYTYDEQKRLLSVTDPRGGTTRYAYNLAGWRTSVTDPVGNVTSYRYDLDGRLIGETNPLGYSASYVYDAASEKIGATDFMGRQTQYVYNEAGWLTGESWLNGQNQVVYQAAYGYDNAGELTSAADNNSSYVYAYDAAGNQTQETVTYPGLSAQPLVTLTSGYDGLGHRTSFADSLGGQITYGYEGELLTQMGLSLSGTDTSLQLTFSYDWWNGRQSSITAPSGAYSLTLSYDIANRVTEMNYSNGLLDFQYAYNAASQVTSYTGPEGTLAYSYDNTAQLTGVSGAQSAVYSYDANGNRTMTGYVTGPDNELLHDSSASYFYNHDGQLASKIDNAGNVWTYTFDNRGRLTEVVETNSGNQVVMDKQFVYDVNNNLIGTTLNGTAQHWTVWDGKNPYLELDGTGNVTQRIVADPRTLNALFGQVSAAGQAEFYLTDQQHSVRMIVSTTGDVLDQITYDAYGNILSQTNAANASMYLFQGGYLDGDLGLYRFGERWYGTNNGRWISQDPMSFAAGDSDLYRYVGNSPTNGTDPTGLITGSLGVGGRISLFFDISLSVDVNIGWSPLNGWTGGLSATGGFGLGAEVGATIDPQFTVTNANSVADLAGGSTQVGAWAACGPGLGFNWIRNRSPY